MSGLSVAPDLVAPRLVAARLVAPPPLHAEVSPAAWTGAGPLHLATDWRGHPAPSSLRTSVRLGWSPAGLRVAFECAYTELDIDDRADTAIERDALWERDVCEAFIQSPAEPHAASYKEFEVAPTGQWCDLAIHEPRAQVDIRWQSGMATAAAIDRDRRVWRAVMDIPFDALGGAPRPGDRWRANLFRISRLDGARQYLTFAPTGTPAPDFHRPERFVPLVFA